MEKGLLSIVCPTYNCGASIRTLIESVLSQTSTRWELLIVDGGSTDDTMDIVREYADRVRYVSEPDGGIYDAMNKGIAMASGEWLYFIGADDSLYADDVIARIQPFLTDATDLLLADIVSPTLGRCHSRFSLYTYLTNTIHHQGCIYHRRVFDAKKFDDSLSVMADYDMNLYIHRCGFVVSSCDIVFANHSPEGVSGIPRLRNYKEEIRVRNRYLGSPLLQMLLAGCSYGKYIIKKIKKVRSHYA